MNIEMRKLSDIRPYENNPRLNDAAVDAVNLLPYNAGKGPFVPTIFRKSKE
jgi:hypothetical protein